jgi:DNA-binding PadR family transcriptional regulator
MLEVAILGLLKDQELHGYELKKRLSEMLGFASRVSFGSLYPALARLEAEGAVKAVEAKDAPSSVPGTGSLAGELAAFRGRKMAVRGSRGKKVYGITARGEELFAELLAGEARLGEDDRAFNLRLAFARYLTPEARIRMLERRRAQLVERLSRVASGSRSGRDRLDGYSRSLIEHDRETTEHDISFIDRLLASERSVQAEAPPAGVAGVPPPASGEAVFSPTISGLRPERPKKDNSQ